MGTNLFGQGPVGARIMQLYKQDTNLNKDRQYFGRRNRKKNLNIRGR